MNFAINEEVNETPLRVTIPLPSQRHCTAATLKWLAYLMFIPAPIVLWLSIQSIRKHRKNADKRALRRAMVGLVTGSVGSAGMVITIWKMVALCPILR